MRRKTWKGFTLIELLVVIAILAVLAAILLPVMANAKKKAKESVSLAQLKQLTAAQMLYAADYNGMFATYQKPMTTWQVLLEPYHPAVWTTYPPYYVVQRYGRNTGYSVNDCLGRQFPVFPDDAKAVLFGEQAAYRRYEGDVLGYIDVPYLVMPDRLWFELHRGSGYVPMSPFGSNYYFGRGAYAFIDGHVGLVRENQFAEAPNNPCKVDAETEKRFEGKYRFAQAANMR